MIIAIIGGSHAGIACAQKAKDLYPTAEVIMIEKQGSIGFVAQSIPLYLQGEENFLKLATYITTEELNSLGIDIRLDTEVNDIDTDNKIIYYQNVFDGVKKEMNYDKLVLATGSYPSLPLVTGEFRDKLYVIKDFNDAIAIKRLIKTIKSVIVIGGGAIGLEVARLLNDQELEVTLLHSHDYLLNRYIDNPLAMKIKNALIIDGIDVHTSSIVTEIIEINEEDKKEVTVKTQDFNEYKADAVIYATGFRPSTFLLKDKIKLGDKGAYLVNDFLQTNIKDVFAVGDCSTTKINHLKTPRYIPHASDAIRQGQVVAENLLRPRKKIPLASGTYRLNISKLVLCVVGLSKKIAEKEGYDCDIAYFENSFINTGLYYHLWLVYEKKTHLILGAQIRGTAPELGAYADIFALAIQQNLTIEDIEYTDFYFKHGYKFPSNTTKFLADVINKKDPLPFDLEDDAHIDFW